VIGGVVAAQLGDRLKAFTVVGSNGLGLERSPTPLERVKPDAGEEEEYAVHRYNLNQLMIHDPEKIDELALWLQKPTMRAPGCAAGGFLARARSSRPCPRSPLALDGIWGGRDANRLPRMSKNASASAERPAARAFRRRPRRRALGASSRRRTNSTGSSPNSLPVDGASYPSIRTVLPISRPSV